MQDVPDIPISQFQLFIAYAEENPRRWQTLEGLALTHLKFGIGIVKSADRY